MSFRVKVCGIRSVQEAEVCIAAGADALGLNFIPTSKRWVAPETARDIVRTLRGRVQWVAVMADLAWDEVSALDEVVPCDWLQLHGSEPPELVARLGARAYKALRIGDERDVAAARAFVGQRLLVDAKVPGELGGSGHAFDWSLVVPLARERDLILAGGLRPDNVGAAIAQVRPAAVDVASGVEGPSGWKEPEQVRAFVERAQAAWLPG